MFGDSEFYERAIIAMCIMVLNPDDYMPEREASESKEHPSPVVASPLFVPAQVMANYILKEKLGVNVDCAKVILYDTDWMNPGPLLVLGEFDMM